METGFNHNFRHHDVLFHVQTEDKGAQNPIVVTQLFHQGNVLATRKSSYEKFLHVKNLKEIIQSMMKEQHKQIMKDLVEGKIKATESLLGAQKPLHSKEVIQIPTKIKTPSHGGKVLDTSGLSAEKTLDELILDFLEGSDKKK